MLPELTRVVFSFGSPCNGQYGHLTLSESGEILGYHHPNERRWSLLDGELRFHSESGAITGRFHHCQQSGSWIGHVEGRKWPLSLQPTLSLGSATSSACIFPPVLVNTIPKSGTYFVEAALNQVGCPSLRLHLGGNDAVDDYRGMADQEIHIDPEAVRLYCPLPLVTSILKSEHVVGHIHNQDIIDNIRAQGVCVLNVIRNLRDVLVSLYRFKLEKVRPLDELDKFWRSIPGTSERFLAFLIYSHSRDIQAIRNIANTMLRDNRGILLRYEELCTGQISLEAKQKLNQIKDDLDKQLGQAFRDQYGKPNPTYSGARSHWQDFWSEAAENYFLQTGLEELNQSLGYS